MDFLQTKGLEDQCRQNGTQMTLGPCASRCWPRMTRSGTPQPHDWQLEVEEYQWHLQKP